MEAINELPKNFQACLSFEGFENELEVEVARLGGTVYLQRERLFIVSELPHSPIWAQNYWQDPQWLDFSSLSEAAKALKNLGPLWASYSFHLHRKAQLIQEKIHRFEPKKLDFLSPLPSKKFGSWCLWNENKILASKTTNSLFPLGEAHFNESKVPPSRAYLKLWELFTLHQIKITKNSHVVDLGCSPGGWTWVLQQLGCHVTAVDKAALSPELLKNKNITYVKKDAFTLQPKDIDDVDVVFSDIICDPKRLYELVDRWHNVGGCKKFVCTLKFKGETDFEIMDKFLKIPHSKIVHLYVNKHEVTWTLGL